MTKAREEIGGRARKPPPSSINCSNLWRAELKETNGSFSGLKVRPKHNKTLGKKCVSPLPSLQPVWIPAPSAEEVPPSLESLE